MPIKFKTMFIMSCIIILLVTLGPLVGAGVAGGLICIYVCCNMFLVRLFIAGIVIFTIGIPALILSTVLYALIYVSFMASDKVTHNNNDDPNSNIIDGEFTEVVSST